MYILSISQFVRFQINDKQKCSICPIKKQICHLHALALKSHFETNDLRQ
jgi:hypothetical protein